MTEYPNIPSDLTKDPEDNVREIEADIAETRSAISEDLRTIGDKLTPENLKAQAKSEVKEAAIGAKNMAMDKVRHAKDSASEKISETASEVSERARDAAGTTLEFLRENALPLAFIGMGAVWLISKRRGRASHSSERRFAEPSERRSRHEEHPYRRDGSSDGNGSRANGLRLKDRLGGALHKTERALSDTSQKARHKTERQLSRARSGSKELAQSSPLGVGAAALVAGVALGLMLPATEKEQNVLGPQRDRLVGEARSAAAELRGVAKDVARDVKESVSGSG